MNDTDSKNSQIKINENMIPLLFWLNPISTFTIPIISVPKYSKIAIKTQYDLVIKEINNIKN